MSGIGSSTSVLYELPFGPGKPIADSGVGGAIFGGWQISAIVNKSSGFPRDPAAGVDVPNTGAQTYRPNLVAGQDPNDGPQTVEQWFNTAAFVAPRSLSPTATPVATSSLDRASSAWTCPF